MKSVIAFFLIVCSLQCPAQDAKLKFSLIHDEDVISATYSPDGKYILTQIYLSKSAKIWDAETGNFIRDIGNGFTYACTSTRFSPDGKYILLISGGDKKAEIWTTATGKLVKTLMLGQTQWVYDPVFTPDGKYFVTIAQDKTGKLWETATGKLIYTLKGHTGFVWSAKFSPNGKYLITTSLDKTARVWEALTGKLLQVLSLNEKAWTAVFSPDGKYVATAGEHSVKIWQTATGKLVVNLAGSNSIADFSPDGKYIITHSTQTSPLTRTSLEFKISETSTGKTVKELTTPGWDYLHVSWKYLVTLLNDNTIKIWDTSSGNLLWNLTGHKNRSSSAMFSPDGKYVATGSVDRTAKIWELSGADNTVLAEVQPIAPKPTAPANLSVTSISFSDKNGNNNDILDASENASIGFTLTNSGKGDAYDLVAEIKSVSQQQNVEYPGRKIIGTLASGGSTTVTIPVSANINVESNVCEFEIHVKEANGFDADPIRVSFNVQKFKNPQLAVADHKFTSIEGGKIKLGQMISLGIVLQNQGQGDATNIKVVFNNPANIFPGGESTFTIDKLKANETRKLNYEFFANKKYAANEIPIEVVVTESYNKYGERRTFNVSLDQALTQMQIVQVAASLDKPVQIDNVSLTSDVDKNVPVAGKTFANRFALIIGNEDYKKQQPGLQSDQNVLFARNDAEVFKEYAIKTFGVPEKQTFMLTDATRAQMTRELERVTEVVKLTPNAELIFYYAGHGLPDMETREGHLIPVDVTALNLKDAIRLKDLYAKLASSNAAKVMVFLDACFSGGGRGEGSLLAARSVKVKPKGDIVEGNIVAFTATSGEEVSLPLHQESHGLFTYHLLKKLKETKGAITLEQLKNYLESEIPRASLIENAVRQTPQVLFAPDLGEKWLSWQVQN